jgi:transglutaminase-like putative cysteine protease
MAGFTRRFQFPRELQVAALIGAAGLPLSRLFRPGGFIGVVLTATVLSIGISWAARRFRIPAVVGLLISVFGMLWFISGRFHAHTLWGPFPTPESFRAIAHSVRIGVDQTIQYAVPVPTTPALLTFVTAGIWMSAWLADAALLWVGNPLLSIAASVPLFATPSTLMPSQRRWLDTGLYLAAAAWVLFGEERARAKRWRTSDRRLGWRPAPAVRVALVGLLVIIVMTPFLPGYGAPPLLRTKGPGDRVAFNPFVAIRATLQAKQRTLFSVVSPRPMYMRLTTLDHFDGDVWAQGNARATEPIGPVPIPADQPGLNSTLIRQDVQIQALAGPWLPAAYDPVAVANVASVSLERESRALVLPQIRGLDVGARYQVISSVADIRASDLDKPFAYDVSAIGDYLQLPRVPGVIRSLAERIAGDKQTPYQKALALQDYLREPPFKYNENVALHHSFKNLVDFLTKAKEGYCEQFAASMAVMARVLGIPARVAIGFGIGDQIGNQYRITTKEAHAWVEIYFPGSGWVAFEPTPRAGVTQVPSYATPGALEPSTTPTVQPTVSATSSTRPNDATRDPAHATVGGGTGTQQGRPAWVIVAIIGAIAVTVVVLVMMLALIVPRLVRRRAGRVHSAASFRYVEFLIWCEGAGLGRRQAETPSEHAARLRAESSDAAEPLDRLVPLVEDALWAREQDVDAGEIARAARDARDALKATLSRRSRLLAATGWGRWSAAA